MCDKSGSQEKDRSIPGRHAAELIPLSLNYNYNCFFHLAGYGPLILFAYRSFKTLNRNGITKRRVIALVVTLPLVVPVGSTILFFSEDVDFQSQWPELVISTIYNYSDSILLSLSILILMKLPRNNPYIYHWILFTSFTILTIVTDFFYLQLSIVDEEFLFETELIWEAMWAFAYLSVLASAFWYYKLTHVLSEDLEYPKTEDRVFSNLASLFTQWTQKKTMT